MASPNRAARGSIPAACASSAVPMSASTTCPMPPSIAPACCASSWSSCRRWARILPKGSDWTSKACPQVRWCILAAAWRTHSSTTLSSSLPGRHDSALAARTPECGALAQHDLPDRRAAHATRFAGATIHVQLAEEITRCTIGTEEVAQGGAPALNCQGEDALHLQREPHVARARNGTSGAAWVDAGGEQGLAGVDIAHADHHRVVHQEQLHRCGAAARQLPQQVAV